jgi:hypothetical protein
MEPSEEIRRLCLEVRSLRLRASLVAGQVALATFQLRNRWRSAKPYEGGRESWECRRRWQTVMGYGNDSRENGPFDVFALSTRLAKARTVLRVPKDHFVMSFTGYMAAENCNIRSGDTVAIWGCGPVGQFAIRRWRAVWSERGDSRIVHGLP